MTQLQLALDGGLDDARRVLRAARAHIDIAEVGTPLIIREGVAAVRRLAAEFPDLPLLADLKIMDAGFEEAELAFAAGASWVTVLGVAHDRTIEGAVAAARKSAGKVCADLVQVRDLIARGRELLGLGADLLCLHTPSDLSAGFAGSGGADFLRDLQEALPGAALAVAGGIGPQNIGAIAALRPAVVVAGGSITRSADPATAAQSLRAKLASNSQ